MKNETIEIKNMKLESGEDITLKYNLVSITIDKEGVGQTTAYGVEIEKLIANRKRERDFVYAISDNRKKVLDMIHKLSHGCVTPITLVNVLNDMAV